MRKNILLISLIIFITLAIGVGMGIIISILTPNNFVQRTTQKSSNRQQEITKEKFLMTFELPFIGGPELQNISESEALFYSDVVRLFEEYQRDHKAQEVLAMFSPPENEEGKNILAWLDGSDSKAEFVRLYSTNLLRYKLNWYMIKSINKSDNNLVAIEILESRTYYDPTGPPEIPKDLYYTVQDHLILEVDLNKKINRYYFLGDKQNPNKYDGFLESPRPQYSVDIPAKYFDSYKVFEYGETLTLKGPEVVLPPVAVEASDTTPLKAKFGGLTSIPPVAGHKPKFQNDIDVDNDGRKEQIVFVPVAMNHAAGEIWIIKEGYVIFKSKQGANISMTESKSHNGFYIAEAISSGTGLAFFGGYRRTRYIYENDAFRPVWYQESFDLQTTKP